MQKLYEDFIKALSAQDKISCVQLTLQALESPTFDIPQFYEHVLAKSLQNMDAETTEIWVEHIQSNIVRTCMELCYPKILDAKPPAILKAMVFCQEEEYHELGARMTSDLLELLGFNATFIGANTPPEESLKAIEALCPHLVCISVTNFFHLAHLHHLVEQIKKYTSVKILVGGYAIFHSSKVREQIKADYYAKSYDDLVQIKEALYASVI